jgi:ribose/xylose/arabinose/galactoside ABC-type transport system permease subunit
MASLLLWLTIGMISGNLNLESLISITTSASFLIVPAIGQMLVITSGRGSIDLSIPGMITLSAFLSARVGGAFLGMGDPYLLETVGSVVVGGTPIFGGKATPTGTFFGGLFLVLLVMVLQIAGYQIGTQYMIKGFLLLLVVVIASKSMQSV